MATRFADHLLTGVIGDRPAATAVPAGTLYASTDESMIYQSDGTDWDDWMEAAARRSAPSLLEVKDDADRRHAGDATDPARGRHERA